MATGTQYLMCREIVLILGMHRSGTSLVAEILRAHGVPTGRRVVSRSRHNTDGHHEDRFLVWTNKKMLRRFHGTWSSPPCFPVGWLEDRRVEKLRDEVRRYREREIDRHARFFFKDPRSCLTLPFWQRSFKDSLRTIVVLRQPRDVVRSLLQRHRDWMRPKAFGWRMARFLYHTALGAYEPVEPLNASKARALWRLYNDRILAHVDPGRTRLVVYERLLQAPEDGVRRLMAFVAPEKPDLRWDMIRRNPKLDSNRRTDPEMERLVAEFRGRNVRP